jgi:hypothetical protein
MKEDIIINRIKELSEEKMTLDAMSEMEHNGGIKKGINIRRRIIKELLEANFWALEIIKGEKNETWH